ncbi:protein DOWNSTREAM OF FLC-like [Humulus lupulus]|uniref:protein DOWNSTREAM OF FLC-like n=1 Tax=Humulus lupulus TaxID=3486 RepID=UPI002B40655A|nr:protein DOWNSTREAM OF FLC-like [Humulus lupulus]
MAKAVLLMALCLLPALASARSSLKVPFEVEGKVFCDTCRAGYETSATTYISGAKVKIECKDRTSNKLVYSEEATTDKYGCYKLSIPEDHGDQVCDAVVVSSPQSDCSTPTKGRECARVILTRNNGMATMKRYVNSLGFTRSHAMAGCANVLKQYEDTDDQY